MRIEITAETPEEKKLNPEPIALSGASDVSVSGVIGAKTLVWYSGNRMHVLAFALCTIEQLRADLHLALAAPAGIAAHNAVANAVAQQAVAQEVLADINGRGGKFPKIARP